MLTNINNYKIFLHYYQKLGTYLFIWQECNWRYNFGTFTKKTCKEDLARKYKNNITARSDVTKSSTQSGKNKAVPIFRMSVF